MTIEGALYNFFNSFVESYPQSSVPETVKFPYGVYEVQIPDRLESGSIAFNIYFYTESESVANSKAREVREALQDGGICLGYDEGSVWLTFISQNNLINNDDHNIKQRQILLNVNIL